jgi:peptidoglycan/xylan/chitin deacetylase (PgdA/CDA1 family)
MNANKKTEKPVASLSLDLDNKWSYMKTHGDAGWQTFPSYLDVVVPRVLEFLEKRDQKITFFIVGQDAALDKNTEALSQISAAGHEIGNHSFHHEPWLHLKSDIEITDELVRAEEEIEKATGVIPRGFRGPGFSFSESILRVLKHRGYLYDASTFPTYLGPLARAYYFMTANLSDDDMEKRKELFGNFSDGFRPLKPYRLHFDGGVITEIPVTTMPLIKFPIHVSYLLYLSRFSRPLAKLYFTLALDACRVMGTGISLLLHPLDFLGCDDTAELAFFPGMNMPAARKVEFVDDALQMLEKRFQVVTMQQHANRVEGSTKIAEVTLSKHKLVV